MTSPAHAFEVKGKGRFYAACQDGCPLGTTPLISVTNAQSVVNKPALPPSAAKITAAAAWELLPSMVAVSRQDEAGPNGCDRKRVSDRCGRCRFCVTSAIKGHYKQEWEAKAELGTRIHTHAYSHVVGRPIGYDEEVEPFLDQYLAFLEAWQVDVTEHVEAAETTIFDTEHGYAGTGDVWLWLPTGPDGQRELWLIDIKTSLTKPATAVYADQVLQLAALRYAPKAVLPDDSEVDVPPFAGAALLNLRTDSHALIPLPADETAHQAFIHAVGLRTFLADQDEKTWRPLDTPALPVSTRKAS
jgi:hypothetical protein